MYSIRIYRMYIVFLASGSDHSVFPSVWPGKCNTTEFGNQLHRSQVCTKYDCYFVSLFFLSKEVKIFVFDVVIRSRLKLGNTKTLICFYCTGFFFRLRKYTCNQAHVSTTDLQYKTNHSRGKKGNKIQTYVLLKNSKILYINYCELSALLLALIYKLICSKLKLDREDTKTKTFSVYLLNECKTI